MPSHTVIPLIIAIPPLYSLHSHIIISYLPRVSQLVCTPISRKPLFTTHIHAHLTHFMQPACSRYRLSLITCVIIFYTLTSHNPLFTTHSHHRIFCIYIKPAFYSSSSFVSPAFHWRLRPTAYPLLALAFK